MSEPREDVEERKRRLLARSTRYRLTLQRDIEALRASLHSPKALLSVAALPPVRSLIFGALLLVAGRSGLGRLLRAAMTVLTLLKAGRAAAGWIKSERPQAPGP
jgi:hypothetical protein